VRLVSSCDPQSHSIENSNCVLEGSLPGRNLLTCGVLLFGQKYATSPQVGHSRAFTLNTRRDEITSKLSRILAISDCFYEKNARRRPYGDQILVSTVVSGPRCLVHPKDLTFPISGHGDPRFGISALSFPYPERVSRLRFRSLRKLCRDVSHQSFPPKGMQCPLTRVSNCLVRLCVLLQTSIALELSQILADSDFLSHEMHGAGRVKLKTLNSILL